MRTQRPCTVGKVSVSTPPAPLLLTTASLQLALSVEYWILYWDA
jgi:hypothetical protein